MDEIQPNDMQDSNSTDYMADDHSFAGISDADEGLHDPMRHPQQEDQVEEDNDPTETFISELTCQFMMKSNQQTLPTLLSRRDDPSPDAPCSSYMQTDVTDLQSPNQLPENSDLERLKVKAELILQELEQETFQCAKPSTGIPRSQLPSTMQNQNSSQNQSDVRHPAEQHPLRMNEKDATQAFIETFRNRRLELGYSQGYISRRLNKLCRNHNMAEIFSETRIYLLEIQKVTSEGMLKMKPMMDLWLEISSAEKPRRFRSYIPTISLDVLEESFQQNTDPSYLEIVNLSKQLRMDRKSVYDWFRRQRMKEKKNKQISHATNCIMPPDTWTTISPDERLVTRYETTCTKSSLNTSDSIFRPWETKAPTTDTNLQALGKDVQQNL